MILDKFYTTEFDSQVVLKKDGKTFDMAMLKKLVFAQIRNLEASHLQKVVLVCEDNFDFVIDFFAGIFAKKEIVLLSDKTRLRQLDFEYIIPMRMTSTYFGPEKFEL